jgi:hypothetical protein
MLPITAIALLVTVGLAWRRPPTEASPTDNPETTLSVAEARPA